MRVRIKELVEKKGITIEQLSKKMDITERTLYRWNSGDVKPNQSNISLLVANLNCKRSELFEF